MAYNTALIKVCQSNIVLVYRQLNFEPLKKMKQLQVLYLERD